MAVRAFEVWAGYTAALSATLNPDDAFLSPRSGWVGL